MTRARQDYLIASCPLVGSEVERRARRQEILLAQTLISGAFLSSATRDFPVLGKGYRGRGSVRTLLIKGVCVCDDVGEAPLGQHCRDQCNDCPVVLIDD
jgi:hypothetical protein